MFNPWLSFGLRAWQIGLEAQSVVSPFACCAWPQAARAEAESSRMAQVAAAQLPCVATMSSLVRRSAGIASAFSPINADLSTACYGSLVD